MTSDIDERLKKVIAKNVRIGIPVDDIREDSDLIRDFLFDSIQVIKLISDIENEFDIMLDNDFLSLENVYRYRELKEYLQKNMG